MAAASRSTGQQVNRSTGQQQYPQQPGYPPQGPPQVAYYGYQPPQRKKPIYKRVWFWLVIAFMVFGFGGCTAILVGFGAAVDNATNNAHTVVYEITGDGGTADVTYMAINGDGSSGTEQSQGAPLPWSKTIEGKGDFSAYSLIGQSSGNGTTISCKITVDDKVIANQTSTGQYAVVSCSGTP